jgi:23S rRNA (cytidine1920-2'-O)/16S rRNA (cytidine1409-2'-O)-methyltransferase
MEKNNHNPKPKTSKLRADLLLFESGLAESREQAKRLIMAGQVYLVRERVRERVDKPGQMVKAGSRLEVKEQERFVSRGGYKLLTAIEHFGIAVAGKVCLDGGASTGGFTDCLLQHGAARVYAVDVGRGQLHEKLARDPRVVALEGVNLRHAPPDLLPEPVDLVTLDVSFISLTLVIPACLQFLKPAGEVVVLVKPQFELGPEAVGRGGVVRSAEKQREALDKVTAFARDELGLEPIGSTPSTIKGVKGNQEFLLLLRRA